jgi:chromosome segregation ATPase
MSRWQTEFEQHAFQENWRNLLEDVPSLSVDDQTVLTAVQELARLKKVVEYLRVAIASIDVELVPKSVWDSFHGQCSPCRQEVAKYKSNRNIGHLQNANQHLDNLLSYVRPYLILPESVIKVLGASAHAYRSEMEASVTTFQQQVSSAAQEIATDRTAAKNLTTAIQKSKAAVDALVSDLIEGSDEKKSIKSAIESTKMLIEKQAEDIAFLHKAMLVDAPDSVSIKSKVDQASGEVISAEQKIKDLLNLTLTCAL